MLLLERISTDILESKIPAEDTEGDFPLEILASTISTDERSTAQPAEEKAQTSSPVLMLSLLEGGVVVHSIVIGMNMGVMTDDHSALIGLIVALSFHQFFEGHASALRLSEQTFHFGSCLRLL